MLEGLPVNALVSNMAWSTDMASIEAHVEQYMELCKKYYTTQARLNSLLNVRDSIEAGRFEQQEKEYRNELEHIEPQMDELKEIVSSAASVQEADWEDLNTKINALKNKIGQEDILLEAGAISKERYDNIVASLKSELAQLQLKARKITGNIDFLKKALSSCTEEKAFSLENDSVVDVYAEVVSTQDAMESGSESKMLASGVYILYLIGLIFWFLPIAGVVIAYVYRGNAGEVLRSHYRFQIRTFWMWILYAFISILLMLVLIGYLLLIFILVWLLVRCIVGLKCLSEGKPVPNPDSWMFGT